MKHGRKGLEWGDGFVSLQGLDGYIWMLQYTGGKGGSIFTSFLVEVPAMTGP